MLKNILVSTLWQLNIKVYENEETITGVDSLIEVRKYENRSHYENTRHYVQEEMEVKGNLHK